ncbi:MAG: hypothetical protein ABJG41_05985 [Cyclobacteriaceae bacterium]
MLLALIPFFFACDDPSSLGVALDDENAKTEIAVEEFVLPSQTIYIDSLLTEVQNNLVFGNITGDSIFGDLKAVAYTEYAPISGVAAPDDSTIKHVKTYAILRYSRATYGSDAPMQTVTAYQGTDTLFASVTYLANAHVDYDETKPEGSLSVPLSDVDGDSIVQIVLDASLADSLYAKIEAAAIDTLDGNVPFSTTQYFAPLVFVPGTDNQNLLNLDLNADTVGIYVEMSNAAEDTTYFFKFNFTGDNFSEIIRDRSTGKYSDLVDDYDSSMVIAGNVHLNTIAGLHPKVSLKPYIDFIESNENIIINRAEVSLQNVPISETVPPVEWVSFLFETEGGRVNGPSLNGSNAISYAILYNGAYTGSLSQNPVMINAYDSDEDNYTVNSTFFFQRMLDTRIAKSSDSDLDYPVRDLILYNLGWDSQTNAVYSANAVGQSAISKSGIKLKIYYTRLK